MRYLIPLITALFISAASAQSLYTQPGPGPSGNVTGPASSTTDNCVKFADTTGKKIADAGAACGSGGSGLTINSTTISGGAANHILSDDGTKLQEIAETGTGNVVLSTSPTLVTPILGTPTSGDASNLTNIPVANAKAGSLLPIANGGSAASTVAGARSSFGVDQRSQYGSTTVNLAVTDHYVTACNNSDSGCSATTWNAAAVWTLPLHSAVNDGDTISIADDLGIVTPTNTLSLVPSTVNAINGTGQIAAGGTISTASATITMSQSPPPWLVAGSNVYNLTAGNQVGTVSTWVSTTLTLTGNASNNGSGSSDVLVFSPNTGAVTNKFTINAPFGAASCKLDATTQNWACYGSVANGAAGTALIGQSNGAPAMTAISGDGLLEGSGALTIVTVTPAGIGGTRRVPMTADGLTQGFPGLATAISGKYFATSGIHIIGSSTGYTALASANSGASNFTLTFPAATDTLAALGTAETWTAAQTFTSGDLILKGASSGTTTLNAAAAAGSTTITLPGGTTDFSATGGASQVVKQTSSGGAFTVARLACADLSDSAAGCSNAAANPTATAGPTAVNGSATTYMRSDGAPAIQKGSSSVFGIVETDGETIGVSSGVISAVSQVGFAGYKAGLYYLPLSLAVNQSSGAAMSVTKTYCMSGTIPKTIHIDEIYGVSGTAGTSNNQYAIYNLGTGSRPGTLVIATGNVANNTTAPASLSGSISSTAITAGVYWFCAQTNDTTVRMHSYPTTIASGGMLLGSATALNTANVSTSQIESISVAGTFGTWPDLTGASWTEETTAVMPIIGYHVLSVP